LHPESEAKKRAVERRLALGACIICLAEWIYTPYSIYASMINASFIGADLERHLFIIVSSYAVSTIVTPYTLFVTSPMVRELFWKDWGWG
jgi:hypothetical protein